MKYLRAPSLRLLGLLAVVAAGCLPAPEDDAAAPECASDADCGGDRVCELDVCWGDPPPGVYSAVILPPTAVRGDSVPTAISQLVLDRDGWVHDGNGASLPLDRAVAVTGKVSIPCAAPGCTGRTPLPGQIRWSRGAGFPGGPRLGGSADVGADGSFNLPVPRPTGGGSITVALAYTPSTAPLGEGLPSPAMLHPPYATELTITEADIAGSKITRDLALDPAALRTITGRITRPTTAPSGGWQVKAEVESFGGENAGTRQLVSTLATTDDEGNYTLLLPTELQVVDVVCSPPSTAGNRPSVRAKDVVVTEQMRDLAIPQLGVPEEVRFDVTGLDSTGGTSVVDGATVTVRLDLALGGGLQLQLETSDTTERGAASLTLFPVLNGAPLPYTVDVLPGPASELASQYDVPLAIGSGTAAIDLTRRRQLAGRILDAAGEPVAGAAVAASLSSAILCVLPTNTSRLARSLASSQVATNARGEFLLFVDHRLPDYALTYDLTVRPATPDGLPAWTFTGLAPQDGGGTMDLRLPAGARVRGVVLSAALGPIEGAQVGIFQHVSEDPCVSSIDTQGTSIQRATGTTDVSGMAALVLPR